MPPGRVCSPVANFSFRDTLQSHLKRKWVTANDTTAQTAQKTIASLCRWPRTPPATQPITGGAQNEPNTTKKRPQSPPIDAINDGAVANATAMAAVSQNSAARLN
jgi:hypothetical protein